MNRVFVVFAAIILTGSQLSKANPPATYYSIDTAAGSTWVGDGGPATSAILLQAEGVAADVNGNVFVADSADHRIRKVGPDGTIHTVAGTGIRGFSGDGGPAVAAQLNAPYGLACDVRGNLYIADLGNARVRRVTPDGIITTIAGGGSLPAGGLNEGSPAVMVAFTAPRNIALDSNGNVYISDFSGQRVYRLGTNGTLNTAAGTGVSGSSGDGGDATRAQLSFPAGLAFDRQDSLYIADSGNHLIRKLTRGLITSVARAATPTGLAFDGSGTLYSADPSAGQILRIPAVGPATMLLSAPAHDVAFSVDGNLYASDVIGVLRISRLGTVTKTAGGGNPAYGDQGDAKQARLNRPSGVAADSIGNLYIADRGNNRIRRVSTDGTISTVAGTGQSGDSGDGANAAQAQLNGPSSVSVDAAGNLYIADTGNQRIRKVTSDGKIAGATDRGLLSPVYAIPDAAGNIYIADGDAGRILKAGRSGIPAVLVSGLASPRGLALDQQGNLYFAEAGAARVRRLTPDGTLVNLGSGVWSVPRGVAVDDSGNVFVADAGLQQILQIDSSGKVTPIAGTGTAGLSGDGAAALSAQLGYPWDVAVVPGGGLVVADFDNNRIRSLSPVSQTQTNGGSLADAVNAASLVPGPVTAGMLLLLRNTGLGPTQIQDIQIQFGPTVARILSADANGILVLAPLEIAGSGSVTINILYQGVSRGSIPVAVADAAPGLFADPLGQATAINENGSLNTQGNPADRGSVIALYGTGLGISGASASVIMGGYSAEILYAGPVSGYPGLFQINARVPAGYVPPGDLSVVVSVGQSSSQPGVAVWVD